MGFVQVCHLQESITQWCMTMVMQTWYQLKAEELLLASTYDLGYEYLRNSWPLNFDYLFLGTPSICTVYMYVFHFLVLVLALIEQWLFMFKSYCIKNLLSSLQFNTHTFTRALARISENFGCPKLHIWVNWASSFASHCIIHNNMDILVSKRHPDTPLAKSLTYIYVWHFT